MPGVYITLVLPVYVFTFTVFTSSPAVVVRLKLRPLNSVNPESIKIAVEMPSLAYEVIEKNYLRFTGTISGFIATVTTEAMQLSQNGLAKILQE